MIERLPPVMVVPTLMVTPCIGICRIEADDLCRGCARTLDEIAGWSLMTPVEQAIVMKDLPMRRG